MIHTILPPEALLPQEEPPCCEWLPCAEGWVQVRTGADGARTVQGVCSTDPGRLSQGVSATRYTLPTVIVNDAPRGIYIAKTENLTLHRKEGKPTP